LPELAARLGRSVEELERRGLSAHDFSGSQSVEIRYPYGHVHRIASAFAVIRPAAALAAVLSEHAGDAEFELIADRVVAEIRDEILHWHAPEPSGR
jgi:hypothetical protein